MDDAPKCFSKFPNGDTPCAKCEYFDSCRYCAATEKSLNQRLHQVSFEAAQDIIGELPAPGNIPGESDDPPQESLSGALGKFFRYLLELDEYTLGMISEIIAPSDGKKRVVSITELAKLHSSSRQSIHRKMLFEIGRHPELSALFMGLMNKLSSGRKSFLCKRALDSRA